MMILFGPSVVDSGVIARVIKRADGSGHVEVWRKARDGSGAARRLTNFCSQGRLRRRC
jgi:hypothetical protein